MPSGPIQLPSPISPIPGIPKIPVNPSPVPERPVQIPIPTPIPGPVPGPKPPIPGPSPVPGLPIVIPTPISRPISRPNKIPVPPPSLPTPIPPRIPLSPFPFPPAPPPQPVGLSCPSCHSRIADDPIEIRVQGAQTTEETDSDIGFGNRPIPRWSDDPIRTRSELNGLDFFGDDIVTAKQIKEIQDVRRAQEEVSGFSLITDFSDPFSDNVVCTQTVITELRQSTEKILSDLGLTLSEYFQLNDNGEVDSSLPTKADWADVERGAPFTKKDGTVATTFELPDGSEKDSPSFPQNTVLTGIHLEDLRRQIEVLGIPALLVKNGSFVIKAKKFSGASFRKAFDCSVPEV